SKAAQGSPLEGMHVRRRGHPQRRRWSGFFSPPTARTQTMRRWIFSAILVALTPLAASAEPPSPAQAGAPSPPGRAPAAGSALPSEGFTLLGEEKGVRVHRRERRSGVEFAAEGSLPAPPDQVRRALLDYPSHQKWQKYLKENKVLARGAD